MSFRSMINISFSIHPKSVFDRIIPVFDFSSYLKYIFLCAVFPHSCNLIVHQKRPLLVILINYTIPSPFLWWTRKCIVNNFQIMNYCFLSLVNELIFSFLTYCIFKLLVHVHRDINFWRYNNLLVIYIFSLYEFPGPKKVGFTFVVSLCPYPSLALKNQTHLDSIWTECV